MNRVGDNLIHFGANEDLVRRLLGAGVDFIVIGGLAMAWHCPSRKADDMDLLVRPENENSERISRVLDVLGFVGHFQEAFASLGRQMPIKQQYYAELLTPEMDGPSYDEIFQSSVEGKLFGMPVRIASIQAMIALKRRALNAANAQRAKHMADLELLGDAV
jgi:hypothetical protein